MSFGCKKKSSRRSSFFMKTFTKLIYSEDSRYYTIEKNVFCSDALRDGFYAAGKRDREMERSGVYVTFF